MYRSPVDARIGAAGFEWLTRNRVLRSVVLGLFACWAVSGYASYFAR